MFTVPDRGPRHAGDMFTPRTLAIAATMHFCGQAFGDREIDHVVIEVPYHYHRRHAPITPEWTARVGSVEIERDRFYLLAGRSDLVRARHLRRDLGALAMVGGLALAASGLYVVRAGHPAVGVVAIGGGTIVAALGAGNLLNSDLTTADDARRLLSSAQTNRLTVAPFGERRGGGIAIAGEL
jgi:hypothetical protein